MPRYHFNIHDGEDLPDLEGVELPDLVAARVEAVRISGECLRDHAVKFWDGHEWQMEVTNDRGLTLFTLTFYATDAPSVTRHMEPS